MANVDWKRFGREIGLYVVAAMVIASLIWCASRLFGSEIPAANRDMVVALISFLIAKAGTIIDYFFGSSKGSSDKSDIIASQTPPAP